MIKNILLPEVSADFESGTIEEWFVGPGDTVTEGDELFTVSTDKANIEVEATESGIIEEILMQAGTEDVEVNTPIATLNIPDEVLISENDTFQYEKAKPSHEPTIDGQESVTFKQDLVLGNEGIESTLPSTNQAFQLPPEGSYLELPENRVRRVIADRLSAAKRDIPHFYLSVDCHLDELLLARKRHNESEGTENKLSVNDFIVKASAMALRENPDMNVAWSGKTLLSFNSVDISIAVDTPSGLITPIISQADKKSLVDISTEIKQLVIKARNGRLAPKEYKGGSFTVSNLGMHGIRNFAAIINPPQSGILAVGASKERAVAISGKLSVAMVMSLTLSVDHRAVDGAVGAKYLQALVNKLETPKQLFEDQGASI